MWVRGAVCSWMRVYARVMPPATHGHVLSVLFGQLVWRVHKVKFLCRCTHSESAVCVCVCMCLFYEHCTALRQATRCRPIIRMPYRNVLQLPTEHVEPLGEDLRILSAPV